MRKDLKKRDKAAAAAAADGASDGEGDEVAFDGIAALHGAKQAASSSKAKAAPTVEDEEDEEAPALMSYEFPDLRSVLEAADVVIEVLDARDPLAFHSTHLEEFVKEQDGKKMLLVLSKIGMHLMTYSDSLAVAHVQMKTDVLAKLSRHGLPISAHSTRQSSSVRHPHSCPPLNHRPRKGKARNAPTMRWVPALSSPLWRNSPPASRLTSRLSLQLLASRMYVSLPV